MTITLNGDTARAEFTQNPVATTEACGGFASVELDDQGAVVAASFSGPNGARIAVHALRMRYGVALTDEEADSIYATF